MFIKASQEAFIIFSNYFTKELFACRIFYVSLTGIYL